MPRKPGTDTSRPPAAASLASVPVSLLPWSVRSCRENQGQTRLVRLRRPRLHQSRFRFFLGLCAHAAKTRDRRAVEKVQSCRTQAAKGPGTVPSASAYGGLRLGQSRCFAQPLGRMRLLQQLHRHVSSACGGLACMSPIFRFSLAYAKTRDRHVSSACGGLACISPGFRFSFGRCFRLLGVPHRGEGW